MSDPFSFTPFFTCVLAKETVGLVSASYGYMHGTPRLMCKVILQLLLILCAVPVFGQSIKTLDDKVADALALEYPDWKIKEDYYGGKAFRTDGGIRSDGFPDQRMHGTWLDGQRQINISIAINPRPEEEFNWFFMRQIMPPTRQLTGIGEKAYLVETAEFTDIAFTKENLFISIHIYFPHKPGKKIHSIYVQTAPKEEVERISRLARGLDKVIDGKRTMTPCYNDFYSPVFPRPKTDSEKLLAAAMNGDTASVKKFISSGISTEVSDKDGNTPLRLAVRSSCTETVQALIDARANLNARNEKQETPLMDAVRLRQLDTVRLLITSGADVKAKNKFGNSAAYSALGGTSRYYLFPRLYIPDDTIILLKMLKDAGLDLNEK
ncbi:MAG: ankyrin repeat domain-containing protein, partial [Pyrinomonadaceae bacterium]